MNEFPELIDEYCWDNQQKLITEDVHNIKGLKNFMHSTFSHAISSSQYHYHSDIIEIHCLLKGVRNTCVNNKYYEIKGNELFITFPFEIHNSGTLSQEPSSFYALQIDLKEKDNMLGLNKEYSLFLYNILTSLEDRHYKLSPTETTLLKNAFELISTAQKSDTYNGVQSLCCFLFNLPSLPTVNSGETLINDNIQHCLNYIDKNLKKSLSLKDISKVSGYSLSRFKSIFREELGITPAEYITKKKIDYAKYLLTHSKMTITEIAFELGFSSSNYFCSVFKKFSNYTPKEYRNL